MIFSSSICLPEIVIISFFFTAEEYYTLYMYQFPSVEEYLDCFRLLAVMNKGAMTMAKQVSMEWVDKNLGHIHKHIAGT